MIDRILASVLLVSLILLGVIAGLLSGIWGIIAAIANPASNRAKSIAIGFDQTLNAATGGSVDETISSRAYKACIAKRKWGCLLCKMLDAGDKGHCAKSVNK